MRKKDALSQWRISTFMSVMPTPAELLYVMKNHKCDKNELIMVKTLLEMHMAYHDLPEQETPFK